MMASSITPKRKPALGGLLAPTREDAHVAQDTVFEYSQRLSQQVIGLEKENVVLQDAKALLDRDNSLMNQKVAALEDENAKLRSAGMATFQERNITVNQAKEAMQEKHGESMLLRNEVTQLRQRVDALTIEKSNAQGISHKLQAERTQLQRSVCALELSADSMHSEMESCAAREAQAAIARTDLERHLDRIAAEKARSDSFASGWHFEAAQLRKALEDLASERSCNRALGGQLEAARHEAARLRGDSHGLHEVVSAVRVEAAEAKCREEFAAQEQPKLLEALAQERSGAAALRRRMADLERTALEHHRLRTAAESESACVRGLLAGAQSEVAELVASGSRAASQACGAGRLADEHAARRHEAERGLAGAAEEGRRLRAHAAAVEAESAEWQAKAQRLEAEVVMLKGQLRGLEVTTAGLQTQCAELTEQLCLQQLRAEQRLPQDFAASLLRATPQPPTLPAAHFRISGPPCLGPPRRALPQGA